MRSWLQRVFSRGEEGEPEAPQPNEPALAPVVQGNLATKPVERRSCARVNLELQVRLRFETADALVASQTFDISRTGAFIAIKEPRRRGTRVRLTIEVDDMVIVLAGVVARSSEGKKSGRRGMGIQFTEITPEASEALSRLLEPCGG